MVHPDEEFSAFN